MPRVPKTKFAYDIDGQRFTTKKAVIDYVKDHIHGVYPLFEPLSADHLRFMVGLLRYHPTGDQKVGCGVAKIWLQKNGVFPTKGFFLERTDGTQTDFSFYQCVAAPSVERDFASAARRTVAPDIIKFRNDFFSGGGSVCPISGSPIDKDNSHVDHIPPDTFDAILEAFINDLKIDIATVGLTGCQDGKIGESFADAAMESEWLAYHRKHARLRVVSIRANLSEIKTSPAPVDADATDDRAF